MSAQPTAPNTAPDLVNIEIDGKPLRVPKNSMIIQAADAAGIPIPRFCYHKKLPIAANCRMCMVETEINGKAVPKPQPACATPVMEGMKVNTQSARALSGQRNAMEFLLINHPLDCPVCDQGGECELQDVSLGYGRSVSRFTERKRVVADEDIGPLVATEMTRCIHCTRCVRVLGDVAGTYEFGDMDRGDRHVVGTYIGRPLVSELSGNVIDVCPVGALTNKVFRFKARAWELIAHESIGYHDALGSNLWLHARRGEVLRTVPRDNEAINECWLSDRDRYSHEGLYASDRALRPMLRRNGELVEVAWDEAIAFVADGLKKSGGDLSALVAPLVSNEEGFLLAQILRALGSDAIDHRLRTLDFADGAPVAAFEMPVADVEKARVIALIGSNPRHEMPLLAQRIRKAWKAGARVYAINPLDFEFNFELAGKTIATPSALVDAVLRLAKAAYDAGHLPDGELAQVLSGMSADDAARALFKALTEASSKVLILGNSAAQHPQASILRAAARFVAKHTGCAYNEIPSGANDIGLGRAGAQPQGQGKHAAAMLAQPPRHLLVYQAGLQDTSSPAAFDAARSNAQFCVYIGSYACSGVKRTAHAVLPIGLPPETEGSYVNVDGIVQTLKAGARAPGEARPGWKVLRALGAALGVAGFDFTEFAQVRDLVAPKLAAKSTMPHSGRLAPRAATGAGLQRVATVPIYRADQVLRRCPALQAHALTGKACVALNPQDALALGLAQDASARVCGNGAEVVLPVVISRAVPKGAAWIESARPETCALPPMGAALTVARA
ncbi:MAG: NADH-quinone oxidoreductase subunit G [Xanthomonadaceae bacterium]|nr:NADH-quinone oxidoreductase subunit G [Xanthomonadaceae bacterium]